MKDIATAKTLILSVLDSMFFYDPRKPRKAEDQVKFYDAELCEGNIKLLPEHVINLMLLHNDYNISYAFIDKHAEKKRPEMIKSWINIFELEKSYCKKMINDYKGTLFREFQRFHEKKSDRVERDIIMCMHMINDPDAENRALKSLDITKIEVLT